MRHAEWTDGDPSVVTNEASDAGIDRRRRNARERGSAAARAEGSVGVVEGGVDVGIGGIGDAIARFEPTGVDHAIRVRGDGGEKFLTSSGGIDGHRDAAGHGGRGGSGAVDEFGLGIADSQRQRFPVWDYRG